MNSEGMQSFTFNMENDNGQSIVKGEINGKAEIPLLDDLKFKAIVALLNSIDKQNFITSGKTEIFDHYIKEIEATINEMKKHNEFQGKTLIL